AIHLERWRDLKQVRIVRDQSEVQRLAILVQRSTWTWLDVCRKPTERDNTSIFSNGDLAWNCELRCIVDRIDNDGERHNWASVRCRAVRTIIDESCCNDSRSILIRCGSIGKRAA